MTKTGCRRERRRRNFTRDEAGSTAIEFALIAPIFLLLLMAIMQMALVLFAGQHLENATATLGRLVRTGQAQGMSLTQATFRDAFCEEMEPLLTCESDRLYIDVQTLSNFSVVPLNLPVNDDGEFEGEGSFQPGDAGQIVVVRAFYRYPVLIPMIGEKLSNIGDGMRLLSSASVFRNEPFN
jgi:Flp pilus assembly protein TadG